MIATASSIQNQQVERRRFQRVRISVYGRYMLQDRTEYACKVIDMSPGNVSLQAEYPGRVGERIIVYLDHIGRIEGRMTRRIDGGFAMEINASERKRDKLAAQLTWLANKHELDLPEDRRHERITPRNPITHIKLPDGRQYQCRIVDLSLSGAAVESQVKPALGTQVFLGSMRGRVVRHFEDGVAIEFAAVQEQATLDQEFSD
ncbi:PilZ domain-containing protein [Nitratireductor basaltis]|uniref:Type IV pilus assembly PilZ n=1 Tax=Nitratireductor basaltis TaxID=472175 RepID=A0A084UAR2_9HYPH|nr:PilZ domain-containing protein [Nitratireductor basaltis]KFB10048.1 Type IV pilus assembly PilZ [Nitratireductor basaltis]